MHTRTPLLPGWLLLSALLSSTPALQAQTPDARPPRPAASAVKVATAPVIDGNVLSDEAWRDVAPVPGGLTQKNPREGAPASEATEVRIAYTTSALYVAVVAFDADPSGIVTSDPRRDSSLDATDSFRFILDTYHNGQTGFVFGTNPSSLEYDAQVVNEGQGGGGFAGQQGGSGGGFNLNWDGSWRVRSRVHERGWSAEFEIPFRTLRFPSDAVQTWGFNFERGIRRRNETAYWAPVPRQFDIARLSLAGTLQNLAVTPPRNLKLIPYALGEARNDSAHDGTRFDGEPGIDLKYSLTPSLTLDATYNTDFAQVEVDEQQVNLDRFNLFFPEKRPFFLENAGLFAVGSPSEAEVFFTRRIGISPSGRTIPLLGGARVSGNVGNGLNVGFLSMQTEEVDGVAPGHNFTVARLRQDLPNRSSIGVMAVNKEAVGTVFAGTAYNRSFAADARVGIGRSGTLSGFAAMTTTPGVSGDEHAYQVNARRETQAWELSASFTEVGEHFRPEVGFLSRTGGFRKPEFLVFHRYRPKNFLNFQELRPHVSYRGFWKPNGFQETGYLHVDNHWEWRNGHQVHTGVNFTREGVAIPFTLGGVQIPAGTYDHQEAQLVAITNEGLPYAFRMRATLGGFFGGSRVALSPTAVFRFADQFNLELSWSRNDVSLPNGRFTTNLARTRASYSFGPRSFLQALVQYNDQADLWSTNLRFGWLQQANTGLFIVYNDTQPLDDRLSSSPSFVTGRSLTIKVSRMIDVLR